MVFYGQICFFMVFYRDILFYGPLWINLLELMSFVVLALKTNFFLGSCMDQINIFIWNLMDELKEFCFLDHICIYLSNLFYKIFFKVDGIYLMDL